MHKKSLRNEDEFDNCIYTAKIRHVQLSHQISNHCLSVSSVRWKILLQFQCRNRLLLTGTPIQNTMAEVSYVLVSEHVCVCSCERDGTVDDCVLSLFLSCGPCCTSSCPRCLIPTKSLMSGSPRTQKAMLKTSQLLMRVSGALLIKFLSADLFLFLIFKLKAHNIIHLISMGNLFVSQH